MCIRDRIVSEYYPKVLPPEGDTAQPVTRLTPHFHDIVLENVTATGIDVAGAIAGLPESPVKGMVLKNVKITAQKGMTIGFADVAADGLSVEAADGKGIVMVEGGKMASK